MTRLTVTTKGQITLKQDFLWVDNRLVQLIFFWFLLSPEVRTAFEEAGDAAYGEASPEQVGTQ